MIGSSIPSPHKGTLSPTRLTILFPFSCHHFSASLVDTESCLCISCSAISDRFMQAGGRNLDAAKQAREYLSKYCSIFNLTICFCFQMNGQKAAQKNVGFTAIAAPCPHHAMKISSVNRLCRCNRRTTRRVSGSMVRRNSFALSRPMVSNLMFLLCTLNLQ